MLLFSISTTLDDPFTCSSIPQELDSTWTTMEFEHDKHDRTGLMLLRASEELIETLEDNQVSSDVMRGYRTEPYSSEMLLRVSEKLRVTGR